MQRTCWYLPTGSLPEAGYGCIITFIAFSFPADKTQQATEKLREQFPGSKVSSIVTDFSKKEDVKKLLPALNSHEWCQYKGG